ncbi:DUF6531 domain-containing protein, partial [Acidovorax sp. SUPP2539]|uniref:DUF6531 domain-containing protein n=1 Tax=Acidovorax sp. SUPP2539 TaxID=2920878 RepID=UPI0024E05BED
MQTDNPILLAAQAKVRTETDWSAEGPADLSFTRHYQSDWGKDAARPIGPLGKAWTHSHSTSLKSSTGATGDSVSITTGEGHLRTFFKATGSSTWTTASNDVLTQSASGAWTYQRSDDDATLQFSSGGKLQSVTARNGWVTSYAYHTYGLLASITNPFGQKLLLDYQPSGRLTSVITPDQQTIGYA